MNRGLACSRRIVWLTVAAILGACSDPDPNRVTANTQAIAEARNFQLLLARSTQCPDRLDGWTQTAHREPLSKTIGIGDATFSLSLSCAADLRFTLVLKYDMDSGTWISGGQSGALEIRYGHFTDSRTLKIQPSDDAAAIANRVVHESW